MDTGIKERGFMPFVEAFQGTGVLIHTSLNDWRVPFEDNSMHAYDDIAGIKQRPKDPWSGVHMSFYSEVGAVDRTDQKGTRSYLRNKWLFGP